MNIRQPTSDGLGEGRLIFRVSTAGGAIPLAGARVIVRNRKEENDPDRGNALAVMFSDRNGKTEVLPLPTVPRGESLTPRNGNAAPPFLCYDAEVTLTGYRSVEFVCIPVFDGVTSVQPADMVPLPDTGREDGFGAQGITIIESQHPSL